MTKKHLFYGTLRQNGSKEKTYNFNRFGGQTYIKTLTIPGFKMINLGYYPGVIEGDGNIVVELHDVTEEAAQKIYFMEKGAGYLSKYIEIDGEMAIIYYCTPGRIQQLNKLDQEMPGGDWCNS